MEKNKKTLWAKIKPNLGIGLFVTILTSGTAYYITQEIWKNDVQQKIFPSVSDLNETLENNAAKPSEKEVYIMGQEALTIKRESLEYQKQIIADADTLKEQAKYFKQQTQRIDSFYIFARDKIKKDSITEKKKEESRAGRDQTNRLILEKLDILLKDTIN